MTEQEKEKFKKAIKELEELIEKDPSNMKSYYFLSFIYLEKERNKALEILKKGIENAPCRGELHSLAGLIYFEDKKYDKALELLLEAEKLSPAPGKDIYRTLGEISFKLKDYEKAGSYYLKASEAGKEDDPDMLFYAADSYRLGLRWNASEMVINRALKLKPEVRFHNLLAFLSIIRFNFRRAFEIYDKIMEIDKKHIPQAMFNKGLTYMVMGNYEETIKIWEDLSRKHPDRADFHYSSGVIHYMSENKDKAIKYFKLCIEKDERGKLAKISGKRIKELEEFFKGIYSAGEIS